LMFYRSVFNGFICCLTKVLQKSQRIKRPLSAESEIQLILHFAVIFRFSS